MVIIFKKRNKNDLNNYRPIRLLSNIYKVLTKVLIKRLKKTVDDIQLREQTGFKSRYSTTDHIHIVNQLKGKCRENNMPFCTTFVDYENTFDSVLTQILTSLQEQGIEDVYVKLLEEIYTNSSTTVHLYKDIKGSAAIYQRNSTQLKCLLADCLYFFQGVCCVCIALCLCSVNCICVVLCLCPMWTKATQRVRQTPEPVHVDKAAAKP